MTWNRFSCSPWASWQTPATRSRHKTWARWLIEQFSFLNSIWIRGPCQPVRPDFPHPIWLAPTTPPPGHVGLVSAPETCSTPSFLPRACAPAAPSLPLQGARQTADPFLSFRSALALYAPTSHTPQRHTANLPGGTWQVLSSSCHLLMGRLTDVRECTLKSIRLTFKSHWPLTCL